MGTWSQIQLFQNRQSRTKYDKTSVYSYFEGLKREKEIETVKERERGRDRERER